MLKIIDYDCSCGLAHGIEDGESFIINGNLAINNYNYQCYNDHSLLDQPSKNNLDEINKNDIDLFVCSPNFGYQIGRRGKSNFDFADMNLCLAYIALKIPDYILIAVSQSSIPYLQIEKTVAETYEGIPTNDIIVYKLKEMGYVTQFFVIDPVTYTLPQHKIIGFYFSAKKHLFDKPIKMPKKVYYPQKSCVCNWLKKVPKNDYNFHHPDYSKKDICEKIEPGSNAKRTKDVSNTSGYIRLRPDVPCNNLGIEFYKVSSSTPSIHPYYDRPLTIREGAVLSGLPMDYIWDESFSKPIVAKMINHSISPIIGDKIRLGLKKAIGL